MSQSSEESQLYLNGRTNYVMHLGQEVALPRVEEDVVQVQGEEEAEDLDLPPHEAENHEVARREEVVDLEVHHQDVVNVRPLLSQPKLMLIC